MMPVETAMLLSISTVFIIAGVALKASAETGEMVLIEHLKEDWTYRLPFRLRNNRYRRASRACYQILVILYYSFKAVFIIELCFCYYMLKGLIFAMRWMWEKIRDSKEAKQSSCTNPDRKQPSNNTAESLVSDVYRNSVLTESAINNLWNHGSEVAWKEALEHYYELLNTEAKELDRYMENLRADDIAQLSVSEFYDFLHDRYFVWKYTAKNRLATTRKALRRYVEENELHELADIQRRLFLADHANIGKCLSIVTEIRGLGPAGASGLLSILFPEEFGTVDQFVVKALREVDGLPFAAELDKMKPESLSVENGVLLIRALREKAEALNKNFDTDFWTPRKIDMILWAIGR